VRPAVEPSPARKATVAALQAALAAENAAIYGYGIAGAQLSGAAKATALRDWTLHQNARDALTAMITSLGAAPVAASAAYGLPFAVHGERAARSLAAVLEDGVTRAYLGLVALPDRALRTFGALAMQGPADRAAFWRGSTTAFPGFPSGALARE
jgi:Domain of unknown function (DUF4439)